MRDEGDERKGRGSRSGNSFSPPSFSTIYWRASGGALFAHRAHVRCKCESTSVRAERVADRLGCEARKAAGSLGGISRLCRGRGTVAVYVSDVSGAMSGPVAAPSPNGPTLHGCLAFDLLHAAPATRSQPIIRRRPGGAVQPPLPTTACSILSRRVRTRRSSPPRAVTRSSMLKSLLPSSICQLDAFNRLRPA